MVTSSPGEKCDWQGVTDVKCDKGDAGEPAGAVTTRSVDEIEFPLCRSHAYEWDKDHHGNRPF